MIIKNDFDPQCITYSQMNLIYNSQMYYVRLMIWIRAYILSRFLGIGTADVLFGRLYREALDQSGVLQIHFGREIANQYGQLLGQFIVSLRNYINAALEDDAPGMVQSIEMMSQNINTRAAFLASINPYWDEDEFVTLLTTFMDYLTEIVDLYADQDYDRDFIVYEQLRHHIELMGYVFAQGLHNYFTSGTDILPEDQPCITYDQLSSIFAIRLFWLELNTWIRNYMISRYLGLDVTGLDLERLRQVPVEFISFMQRLFGEAVGSQYIQLYNNYIDLIDQFITAQMENDALIVNETIQQLYQNAEQQAAFVASLNPYWNQEQWRNLIRNNLRTTINESTTFLTGNYPRNIEIFSSLLDQSESMSNAFAEGLFQYLRSIQGLAENTDSQQ